MKARLVRWLWWLLPIGVGFVICTVGVVWYLSYHIRLYQLHADGLIPDHPPGETSVTEIVSRRGWQRHSVPGLDLELPEGMTRDEKSSKSGLVVFQHQIRKNDGFIVSLPHDANQLLLAAFSYFDIADMDPHWPTLLDLRRAALTATYASFRWDLSRSEAKQLLALSLYRTLVFGDATQFRYGENAANRWLIVVNPGRVSAEIQTRSGASIAEITIYKPESISEAVTQLTAICDSAGFHDPPAK